MNNANMITNRISGGDLGTYEATDDAIVALRTEAGIAGDDEMVKDCDAALEGDAVARAVCSDAIAEAQLRMTEV